MLSCDQHDYIEIACLYQLDVKLQLKSGESLQGKALHLQYNEDRQECLLIKSESTVHEVLLNDLSLMQALKENPHFNQVNFS